MAERLIIPGRVITRITGTAIPKLEDDQNTDAIIPGKWLKVVSFEETPKGLYEGERFLPDGTPNPDCVFNMLQYKKPNIPNILIAGDNYGCGSSREHAPQAIKRYGIDAIIAKSFAGIFEENCEVIGLVTVAASPNEIDMLGGFVQRNPKTQIYIDLEAREIGYGIGPEEMPFTVHFPLVMPEDRRDAYLRGLWDPMVLLPLDKEGIERTRARLEYLTFR